MKMLHYIIKYKYPVLVFAISMLSIIGFCAPFDSNVWGNVSDWTMILVTAITGLYLIMTFHSQQKILLIEQSNFRAQFLPELKAEIITTSIKVTVNKNPILNLRTFYHEKNIYNYYNLYHHYGEPDAQDEIMIGRSFTINVEGNKSASVKSPGTLGIHDEVYLFILDSQYNLYEIILSYNWQNRTVMTRVPKYLMTLDSLDLPNFNAIVDDIAHKRHLIKNRI